jgi:sterol 24-C-methyltransferase
MMAPTPQKLEQEDHNRDLQFAKALHGDSGKNAQGIGALMSKSKDAQKAAVDEYFKHWDNKPADEETDATREERRDQYATLTKQSVVFLFFP